MKLSYFQAVAVSVLLYGCMTWTLTKRLRKKLDGKYARMVRALLNNPGASTQESTNDTASCLPYRKLVTRTRHAGHCLKSRDELISAVLLWTPTYGRAKAGWPARTYIQQLCEDTGCSLEDLPKAMNDRENWRERLKDIRASGMKWWWYIYPTIIKKVSRHFSYG